MLCLLGLNIGLTVSMVEARSCHPERTTREEILDKMRHDRLVIDLDRLDEQLRRIERALEEHDAEWRRKLAGEDEPGD